MTINKNCFRYLEYYCRFALSIFYKKPMRFRLILLLIFASLSTVLSAQNNYAISGYVRDASSGEELIGSTIYVEEIQDGAATNEYGFYSLTLAEGTYKIRFSYIGFQTQYVSVKLTKDMQYNLDLMSGEELDEVVIKGDADDANIRSTDMGIVKLDIKEIEAIPVLFGEQDILKTLQLMPGISTGGEGRGGYYVRGGNTDQNLILLDEAPVYNASHLLGFFSVFNSDALKEMTMYKAGIPSRYGGRLSSVLDVRMNNGNMKRFSFSGGLGIISSRLTIEGPIVKDKGSFIVSGRRTYADLVYGLVDPEFKGSTLYFYDLNAKANYKIGKKDRIFISGYFGRDKFGVSTFGFDWGNSTATVRWSHVFNDKLFLNTSLIYSNYDYKLKVEAGTIQFQLKSGIEDLNLKQDYAFYINSHNTMRFGFNIIDHTFKPGERTSDNNPGFDLILDKQKAFENAIYISNEQKIGTRFMLEYGIRGSMFHVMGPGTVYDFDSEGNITGETEYGDWEVIKTYWEPEPRISLSFVINEKSSVKGSFHRMAQYIHLLSSSTSDNPTDVWVPSSNLVKPGIANQYSIGYYRNFADNAIETSVEVYYKDMFNQVDYRDGADVLFNELVEAELVFGKGRSYGIEFFVKKRLGKFTGWIGYTLSKTEKQFDYINDGEWFSARQDRTNDVSVVGTYQINKKISVSATWVYYTGDAVTMPSGTYIVDGQLVPLYTERNGYRMPDYHRLDIGLTLKGKETKKFKSSWNFSLYNAYARENAYSITFQVSEDNPPQLESVQTALFSIIPSVTWNFKF